MAQGRQQNVARGPRLIARSGLRFDKVALAFVARLQDALRDGVPDGKTLVVTCTAPIRLPGRTAAAAIEALGAPLAREPARLKFEKTINGNRVRAWLVKRKPARADKVIGFVHNPDVDPEDYL